MLLSLLWLFLFLLLAFTIFREYLNGDTWPVRLSWLAVLVLAGLLHFFIVMGIRDWGTVCMFYGLFVLTLLAGYPGAAFLGGLALRELALGGNLPISVSVKTIGMGIKKPSPQ